MKPDYLIDRLRTLCQRFDDNPLIGRFEVARRSDLNEQYLYQILAGKSSKAGKPRSIGMNARAKLTKAFPDWLNLLDINGKNDQAQDTSIFRRPSAPSRKHVRDLLTIAERINNEGLMYLIGKAEEVEKEYPLRQKQTRAM